MKPVLFENYDNDIHDINDSNINDNHNNAYDDNNKMWNSHQYVRL